MTYDSAGNLTETIRPSGTAATASPSDGTVSYTYDLADRLIETSYSDNTATIEYDYSAAGRVTLAERVDGSAVVASSGYSYDDAGRVESILRSGPAGGQTDYSYTTGGRLSGVVWSTGMGAAFDYNEVGSLAKVTPVGAGGVPEVEYGYNPAGQITSVTRDSASPVTSTASVDAAGQLTSLSHMAGSTVVKEFDVTRDVRGLPTQVDTTTSAGTSTALYDFDTAGRVVSECYPAAGNTCGSTAPGSLYTYDDVGNRTSSAVSTVTGAVPSTVTTDYVHDDADQLLSETVNTQTAVSNTWTANGTLASSSTATGTTTYTSDLADELISVVLEDATEVTYSHDAHGNRTSRTIDGILDVSWAWDELSALPIRIGEYDHTDTLTTTWLPDPTSSTGGPLAETDVTSTDSEWLLADPFMNVTTAIDTTTSIMSGTSTLDVFGNHLSTATGTLTDSPVGFSGQHLDSVTGLYDMCARDYHPTTGRFTAQDPIQVPTGMPYFATCVYGHNNPLMFTDPSGNWPSCNDLFGLCDSPAFAWNMLVGAKDAAVDVGSAIINPIDTYWGAVDACNAGFDEQSGGTGATFEGFLQCVDNLNPMAAIRDNVGDSLNAECIDESGQSFWTGPVRYRHGRCSVHKERRCTPRTSLRNRIGDREV